jgi:hypothetical protein
MDMVSILLKDLISLRKLIPFNQGSPNDYFPI